MKEKIRKKKGIYVTALLMMMLGGVTSFVWGQPVEREIGDGRYRIYGGDGDITDGGAEGNRVALSNRRNVVYVYGGDIRNGVAKGNIVTLTSMRSVREACGGHVDGDGRAEGNELRATDTTVGGREGFYGGKVGCDRGDGNGEAVGNRVILHNVVAAENRSMDSSVCGGWVKNRGRAIGNEVAIDGGRILRDRIYGGRVGEGTAQGNSVTLDNVTLGEWNGSSGHLVPVYGGRSGSGGATGNRITLIRVQIEGDVYGGFIREGGTATGNLIDLEGNVRVRDKLYGGWIEGRYFSRGEHVSITFTDPSTGRTISGAPSPDWIEETRHGFYIRPGDAFTGNTLNLRHCQARVGRIGNFEYMNFIMTPDEFLGEGVPLTVIGEPIDLRRVGIRLTMEITDASTLIGLVGKEKVLIHNERKIKNYNPVTFIFRTEGNVEAGSPIPEIETYVSFLGKTLVAKVKRLMIPRRPTREDPLIPLTFERMNDLSKIRTQRCCNVM